MIIIKNDPYAKIKRSVSSKTVTPDIANSLKTLLDNGLIDDQQYETLYAKANGGTITFNNNGVASYSVSPMDWKDKKIINKKVEDITKKMKNEIKEFIKMNTEFDKESSMYDEIVKKIDIDMNKIENIYTGKMIQRGGKAHKNMMKRQTEELNEMKRRSEEIDRIDRELDNKAMNFDKKNGISWSSIITIYRANGYVINDAKRSRKAYAQVAKLSIVVTQDLSSYNNTKTTNNNAGRWERLIAILRSDVVFNERWSRFKDYIDRIDVWDVHSTENIPQEKQIENIDGIVLFGDKDNKGIDSKFIKYNLNKSAEKFSDLFGIVMNKYTEDNFKANSCFLNAIIDNFHAAFKKRDANLTYEKLCKIVNVKNAAQDIGLTIRQSIPFFEKFNLGLDVISIFHETLYSYRPVGQLSDRIERSIMRILIHNNHCYLINDTHHKQMHETVWDPVDKLKSNMSDKYYIRKIEEDDEIEYNYVTGLEDITTYMKKIDDDKKKVKFIYEGDMIELLLSMTDVNYYPSVAFCSGKIMALNFNIGKIKVSVTMPDNTAPEDNDIIVTENMYIKYVEADNNFYNNILKKEYISEYPEDVRAIENMYPKTAISGYLTDKFPQGVSNAIDTRKAYIACLKEIAQIPVFSYFDKYEPYLGNRDTIDPLSIYIVECDIFDKSKSLMFPSKISRCYGFKIIECMKMDVFKGIIKILFVRKPHKTKNVQYKEAIEELWNNEDISKEQKKFIGNKTTGFLEKKSNKKTITKIFESYTEAQFYQVKYGGKIHMLCKSSDKMTATDDDVDDDDVDKLFECRRTYGKRVYLLVISEEMELSEGFVSIKEMIYDMMNIKMYDLYERCTLAGLNIVGVKTDCILVNNSLQETIDHFDYTDIIGGLKFEFGKKCVKTEVTQERNELVDIKSYIPTVLNVSDEYDKNEINNIIDKHNRIIFKALLPGSGKSTALINYSKSLPKNSKMLFVTPINKLAQNIRMKGVDATTVHKLLGFFKEGKRNMAEFDTSKYTVIVFDEIYMYSPSVLSKIDKYINKNADKKFAATGDPLQLDPIDSSYTTEYQTKCIDMIFNNQVILKICKRVKTEKERNRLNRFKKEIFDMNISVEKVFQNCGFKVINDMKLVDTKRNLTYFRDTSERVNKHIHSSIEQPSKIITIDGIKYWKGLELLCRESYINGNVRLFTNYQYVIKKINNKEFTVEDILEEGQPFTLPTSDINNLFKLCYSSTVHSSQGTDIDEKCTIFDCYMPHVSRKFIYTAITRLTDLRYVQIFMNSEKEVTSAMLSLRRRFFTELCSSYASYDKKGKISTLSTDRIDDLWFKDQCKNQNKCPNCNTLYYVDVIDGIVHSNVRAEKINVTTGYIKNNCDLTCTDCINY